MEKEYIQRLGKLYRDAKASGNTTSLDMAEASMNHFLSAESSMTSMMVAESLAIATIDSSK